MITSNKKINKIIFTAFLITTILLGSCVSSLALDSNIVYENDSKKFICIPDDTDLFQNFKGILPGDSIDQKIIIKNTSTTDCEVEIYLKVEETSETYKEFLHKIKLRIVEDNNKVLFDGFADEQGGLKDNVSLGRFKANTYAEITVTLDIPSELKNDFADREGIVEWVFSAEEFPTPDPSSSENAESPNAGRLPLTGDVANLFAGVTILSVLGGTVFVLVKKRKSN